MKILIPDAESGHTMWVCEGLSKKNKVEIHAMSTSLHPALRYSKKCKSFKHIKYIEKSQYLKIILEYAKEIKADIILPIDEPLTEIFSINIELIQSTFKTIPIPTFESFKISTNKQLLAQFCKSKEIPVPITWDFKEFTNISKRPDFQKFPIIIKPESGNGGKNIFLINSKKEFDNFNLLENNTEYGQYFVQEYINGYDIDMSVLCKDGKILAYTIQKGIIKRKISICSFIRHSIFRRTKIV